MRLGSLVRHASTFFASLLMPDRNVPSPIHIQLEPTTHCNMRCTMCIRTAHPEKNIHFQFEKFKELIDQLKPLKINLTGNGESSLHPDFVRMVDLCKGRGIYTYFNTNLCGPLPVFEKLIEKGVDIIKVSLDAGTRESYFKVRQTDFFERLLSNLRHLMAYREKLGSRTVLRINSVLMRENLDEMRKLMEIAKEYGSDVLVIKALTFYGDKEGYRDYYGFFRNHLHRLHEFADYGDSIGLRNDFRELAKEIAFTAAGGFDREICLMPWISTYIGTNGNVLPCCYLINDSLVLPEEKGPIMGNIHKQSWKEIWNGERYRNFRRIMRKKGRPFASCTTCCPPFLRLILSELGPLRKMLPGLLSLSEPRKEGGS